MQNGIDKPTRLLRFVTFVHLPFSAGSLDLYHARFTRVYEGHFMPCYGEEISRVEPLDSAVANFKRS